MVGKWHANERHAESLSQIMQWQTAAHSWEDHWWLCLPHRRTQLVYRSNDLLDLRMRYCDFVGFVAM